MKFAFISPFPPLRGGISKETETIYNYFNNNGHNIIPQYNEEYDIYYLIVRGPYHWTNAKIVPQYENEVLSSVRH